MDRKVEEDVGALVELPWAVDWITNPLRNFRFYINEAGEVTSFGGHSSKGDYVHIENEHIRTAFVRKSDFVRLEFSGENKRVSLTYRKIPGRDCTVCSNPYRKGEHNKVETVVEYELVPKDS